MSPPSACAFFRKTASYSSTIFATPADRILSAFLAEVEETVREKYDDMSELEHQKQFIMMLNSINYLRTVLSDWSDQVVCSAPANRVTSYTFPPSPLISKKSI
jgi:hypothetical protein